MAEIHTVAAPTPQFFLQVQLLAASIRRNGGAFADAPIVVTVSRDREPFDLAAHLPWSGDLGVEWRWVDETVWDAFGMYGSAMQRFRYEFDAPYVVMLDADMVCTGPLDDLPRLTGSGIGGVIANVSPAGIYKPWRDGGIREGENFWFELFDALDLDAPDMSSQFSAWGVYDFDPAQRWTPPYYNLGMIAGTAAAMRDVGDVCIDELIHVERVTDDQPFRCQLAVSTALARLDMPTVDLSLAWNFPNDPRLEQKYPKAASELRVLHYMQPGELDRGRDFASLEALDAFCERTNLTSLNRVLQQTVRALREELLPIAPLEAAPQREHPQDELPPIRYPFARPLLPAPDTWHEALQPAYESRWFSNGGPVERRFAEALEQTVPGRSAALVGNATVGITAALLALDVRGRVAVPAFTFPATIHAIEMAGCEPVLCDIDEATWELSPDAARRAIDTYGCSAIVHVRAYGLCRDLTDIEQVARDSGVPLVIDAAAAYGGTTPDGMPVGSAGDAEVFSFHATKVFGIGEGGAVFASPELVERIRHVSNFSIDGSDVLRRGLNGKLSAFASAIGIAMLDELDEHLAVRKAAASTLLSVARFAGAVIPETQSIGAPPWQCVPLLAPSQQVRDAALAHLRKQGIEGRSYYCPGLHRSTAWHVNAPESLPATDAIAARLLCMPVYADLAGADLKFFSASLIGGLAASATTTIATTDTSERRAA